jgi:hypothetical protein
MAKVEAYFAVDTLYTLRKQQGGLLPGEHQWRHGSVRSTRWRRAWHRAEGHIRCRLVNIAACCFKASNDCPDRDAVVFDTGVINARSARIEFDELLD